MALNREEIEGVVSEFAQGVNDTGSVQVQIALLTKKIKDLTEHCQRNPKDFSCRRGLLQMVCDRRGFLGYLQKKNEDKYKELITKLGLRK